MAGPSVGVVPRTKSEVGLQSSTHSAIGELEWPEEEGEGPSYCGHGEFTGRLYLLPRLGGGGGLLTMEILAGIFGSVAAKFAHVRTGSS